jgi:hypothetical protein
MDDRFIWIEEDSLTHEFCDHIIQKYEVESFKSIATTIGGYSNVLQATEVNITNLEGWIEEDTHLFKTLNKGLDKYRVFLKDTLMIDFTADMLIDSGYKIKSYSGDNGDRFDWHQDYCSDDSYGPGASRYLSYIWYLNNVEGGETEFVNGFSVKPEVGKLLIFPSTWTYIHRGKTPPPGTTKYICSGFLYAQSNPYINNNQKQNNGEG